MSFTILFTLYKTRQPLTTFEFRKILASGHSSGPKTTTLIISNDEMKDIIEIAKSLEYSGLLLKGVSKTSQNESKERKGGFLSMLLGTLSASLLGIF